MAPATTMASMRSAGLIPPVIGGSRRPVEGWATIAAVGRRGRNRPEPTAAPEKTPRLRMGSEKPGSVVKGPPITVTCECGERHDLFYGERWTCPSCGRAYDTHNIPEHEYAGIRNLQRRYRAVPIALGVVVATLALVFILTSNIVGDLLPDAAVDHRLVRLHPPDAPAPLCGGDPQPAAVGPARGRRAHAGGWCRPNAEP